MWDTVKKLRDILDVREQRRALLLLVMVLFMGLVESSRVASILPFVAVLASPGIVQSNPYIAATYDWFGFTSTNQYLVFLGIALFIVLIITLSLSAVMAWASTRFTSMRNYTLSRRLFQTYLERPYEWFLGRNSSDLSKSVLSEVNQVISGSLMPLVSVVTDGILAVCMIGLLIVADPLLAVFVTLFLGGGYGAISWLSRRYLTRLGEERLAANKQRFLVSNEAFAGIKDVKVLGMEGVFLKRFEVPSFKFVRLQVASSLISGLPSYAFQAVAFAIVLGIVLYQVFTRGDIAQALPVIALYALAGQRLMPALQSIYKSIAQLRYSKPALNAIHRDLVERPAAAGLGKKAAKVRPLGLTEALELRDVTYTYPVGSAPALSAISLKISARTVIGVVGQTGAGKTTLVDIVLGLLEPQEGALVVDGQAITDANRAAWLKTIGYVPQHIFLSDDTVAGNIAFGVAPAEIDMVAVKHAARVANLHRFVDEELEKGYATMIGERGIRLSGGQRQRIGIARALYRDPDLLIMDEGTSALDNVTERAVMEAVNNLGSRKTIILIAHRLTSVRKCDQIFLLDRGRVAAIGTYDELALNDERFKAMVGASHG